MSDKKTRAERRKLTILADIFFNKKDFHKAFEYYVKAGNIAKLRFHGRNFANQGYFSYAAQYLKAARCKLADEKMTEYMSDYFREGKCFHIIEPLKIMDARDELIHYGNLCLKENRVLMALIFYSAAGMEFTGKGLTEEQIGRLIQEADEYIERGNPPKYAILAYKIAGEYSKLLDLSILCLRRNWLEEAIEIYKTVITEALLLPEVLWQYKQTAASFGNRYLVQGDYEKGIKLYKAIGVKPHRSELVTCGNMGLLCEFMLSGRVFDNTMRAFRKAGAIPSKRRIKEAADYYQEKYMILEAIDAYEAAEDTDSLWLLLEGYSGKEYCGWADRNVMEKIAQAIAKAEEKISKIKNR